MNNKIYLAGGCFWCIADFFNQFEGIVKVISGYSGGEENPVTYQEVKAQKTNHRETIEITYNANINIAKIIDLYFKFVDPTDKDGQYQDRGHSYTLAMFYQNDFEKEIFNQKKEEYRRLLAKEIYVDILPFKFFIEAENYHQDFGDKNPEILLNEMNERLCHMANGFTNIELENYYKKKKDNN